MPALAGQRILTVGGTSLAWEDLVLAGCLWGDWPDLEKRVRDGLACLARLDDLDEDDEAAPAEDEVEAAAAEFRYARDLVAAADLEGWLERRGLTVDAWLDFVRRDLLRARWAGELDAIREEYEIDADELAGALECEAICSGLAAGLAARLAGRAAIHARDQATADAALAREAEAIAASVPDDLLARALPEVAGPARRERLQTLAGLEAAWRRFATAAAPPEALRALVGDRRLDWLRVGVQTVTVPDEDVAREIVLCVRDDGRPLDEVAVEAGLGAVTAEVWVEDAPEALREALIGARSGELLGPVRAEDAHLVVAVGAKRWPSEDDPLVRARAEHALLARTVDREVADRVTWHETL